MENVHNGRKYQIFSAVKLPKSQKQTQKFISHLYFIKIIFPDGTIWHKIGESCRILERMKEHAMTYGKKLDKGVPKIEILWVSPLFSATTAKRVEHNMKIEWQNNCQDWQYLENDRFIIPPTVEKICIKVRKKYDIFL